MRGSQPFTGLALAILLVGLLAAPAASAAAMTQTIQPGEYLLLSYEVRSATEMSISVTANHEVDVFVLDEENYAKLNKSLRSYDIVDGGSFMGVTSVDAKVKLDPGMYYVIIDNSQVHGETYAGRPATVAYEIANGPNWVNVVMIAVAAVAVIAAVLFLLWRRRKKRSARQTAGPVGPSEQER
ncbi:hypothetical protein [Methanomassiliicoccus luminyensis]|jgi:hypothetical protein|uniref:hypothetical protein n=1 Tax=Methanomassiliicoccus luminyensis TaxID=1080712 RepID=UPI0011CA8FF6|nr:hypothetical protein [Methanomassiliicoccus luminyensis]